MVAGGGSGEEEWLQQWRACCGIVRAAAAHRPHGGVVGAGGVRQACFSIVGAGGGCRWQGGMREAEGVPLHCWGVGGVVGA